MKILITGAQGLIGSHLVLALQTEHEIYALSRSVGTWTHPQLHWVQQDLTKPLDPARLPAHIDAVIHLAQSEHFRDFPARAEEIFQVNTVSTVHLLDYARLAGAQRFVLASSGGIYGHGEQEFAEDANLASKADLGFYLGTKLCSEVLAENYTALMNMIMLRFFFVYGPRQRRTMLIPRLVQAVMDGNPIVLQGPDGFRLNPTHVSDAVVAIRHALGLDSSQKINIGGPEVLSLRQVGEIIGQVVNKEPMFDTQLAAQPRHLVGDISKMTRLLGAPQMKFEAGIRAYVEATYG